MTIYTLIENTKPKGSAFLCEHGLSLYFEHNKKHILFDTGSSDTFIYNATLLGIDLAKVDVCVISHGHFDHAGGLSYFLNINKKAAVYMKRTAQCDLYTKKLFRTRQTGMPQSFFEKYGERITYIDDDTQITDGVFAANINTYRGYPQHVSAMYCDQDGKLTHDDLSHELFITAKTNEGHVVLTGCSHHGLINILQTAQENYGKVYAVIGGFHLGGFKVLGVRAKRESSSEIRAIAKYFDKNGINKIYTGHCTGERPLEKLTMLSRTKKMQAGDIIKV
jgi:7,8-dihydropterin-6-yl-methyl-4-(beta-D-ribofuranosyl)aminobenzene 5'-phosphate synthase